jgi:predicted nucleotidyltransferase/DNA-binding XRE family transcriptional regulator
VTLISTIRYSDPVASEDLTAAGLLREARQRAGMSQVELAARAGVTQSVISAYESGHRQPSVPTLAALIEATGFELATAVRRQPRRLEMLSGPVGQRVSQRRRELVAAAAAHGVTGLRVFGSVARGQDRPDSDVDLLAELPPGMSLFGLARLQAELEGIVGTRVDLVPAADLKPDVRERAGRDLVAL